ncbi:hypothetical protein [Nostoc sp.]|uniref:hypothetical protein n=1 Tax=Nostoc sp. TaxID=1180 RepID=UPI002FF69D82
MKDDFLALAVKFISSFSDRWMSKSEMYASCFFLRSRPVFTYLHIVCFFSILK